MPDTAISALAAVTAGLLAQEIPVNDAGTTRKLTLTQLMTLLHPSDVDASGTSTTSATAVDSNIALTLPVGTYQLLGAGMHITAAGTTAIRFTCTAADGLVGSNFNLTTNVLTGGTSSMIGATNVLGTITPQTTGTTTSRPFTLQGAITVTTAGTLKLQIASEIAGSNVTMSTCYFTAFRIA